MHQFHKLYGGGGCVTFLLLVSFWISIGDSATLKNHFENNEDKDRVEEILKDTDDDFEESNKLVSSKFEAAFQGKCGQPNNPCIQICVELHDGTFECQCRQNYRLSVNGYSCIELSNNTYSAYNNDRDSDSFESQESRKDQIEWVIRQRGANQLKLRQEEQLKNTNNVHHEIERDVEIKNAPPPPNSLPPHFMNSIDEELNRFKKINRFVDSDDGDGGGKKAENENENEDENSSSEEDSYEENENTGAEVDDEFEDEDDQSSKNNNKQVKSSIFPPPPPLVFEDEPKNPSPRPPEQLSIQVKIDIDPAQDNDNIIDDDIDDEDGEDFDDDDDYDDDFPTLEKPHLEFLSSGTNPPSSPVVDFNSRMLIDENVAPAEPLNKDYNDNSIDDDGINIFTPSEIQITNNPNPPTEKLADQTSTTTATSTSYDSYNYEATTTLNEAQSEVTEAQKITKIVEDCPLKCMRGVCAKDSNPGEETSENDDIEFRCLCPMGWSGALCDQEDRSTIGSGEYTSALFRGHSWVAFPVLHDAYMADQISLEFRPESPNGILLLTGERDDLSGDFLTLFIRDSYLEFRFDCGSGQGQVRSSHQVQLQKWNKVNIMRRKWDGWLQLNDGPFTQGRSKGLFSRITFRQPVIIGGAGNISLTTSSSSSNSPLELESETEVSSFPSFTSTSTSSPEQMDTAHSPSTSPNVTQIGEEESTIKILKNIGGFRGCIKNLVINDRTYRFGLEPISGDAISGFDIEQCNDQSVCDLIKCHHGGQCVVQKEESTSCLCPLGFTGRFCEYSLDLQIPSFNGSSYLKYEGLGLSRVLSWLELELVLKIDAMDGLILYNGYCIDGTMDFISLIVDQGHLEFAIDLGTGTAFIRSERPIALGEWHRILISRTSRLISLKIDNQSAMTTLTPGAFTQLTLPHNLFLGGIPEPEWLSPKVKVHGGFSGCIQKVVINEKPLRIMGSAISGVNLDNCVHPCLRNPCENSGECIPDMDMFTCHCKLGFRDSYCQTKMEKDDLLASPRFTGDSYLRYTHSKIIKRISGTRLSLSFRLKTSLSRGVILWAGRKLMSSTSDFLSIGLKNGFISTSFSLGSGQINIAYNTTPINDDEWHRIQLIRNEQEARLTVDNGPPIIGISPGKLRQLNINDGLYIGGLDDPRHQSMNKYTDNFVGCLMDLSLGSDFHISLIQDASEGRNVEYCD